MPNQKGGTHVNEECTPCMSISEVIPESDGSRDGAVFGKDRGFALKTLDRGNKLAAVGLGESAPFPTVLDFGRGAGAASPSQGAESSEGIQTLEGKTGVNGSLGIVGNVERSCCGKAGGEKKGGEELHVTRCLRDEKEGMESAEKTQTAGEDGLEILFLLRHPKGKSGEIQGLF